MVELLVMRHAKSAWDTGDDDIDRPLAPRGERAAARMGEWIVASDLCPDLILTSSAVRARRTGEIVAAACGLDPVAFTASDEFYDHGLRHWIETLRTQDAERILICGHNPTLDDLVVLVSDRAPVRAASGKLMTTAAIAHISFDGWPAVGRNAGTLHALVRPRELAD